MSAATYKVVFCGRLVDGYSEDRVKSNLARSFKLTPEQLRELFSGTDVVIKNGLSIETARQVQSAFVRQGVVTILRKVTDGDATFADELWRLVSELGYQAMRQLSILYRASETRFPGIRSRLDSMLPDDIQHRLANGASRPAAQRPADGSGHPAPGTRQIRELSTKLLRRVADGGGRLPGSGRLNELSTKLRWRGLGRLPRFGLTLRRLKAAAILAILTAGVAGAVIHWPSDLQWMVVRAKLGLTSAQIELAAKYQNGDGVAQSDERALHWFRVAAERGDALAQSELGAIYEHGRGVSPDPTLAATWYGKAARQGRAQAQDKLGDLYQTGNGVTRDDARAALWYRKAAEQGHVSAQNKLGVLYARGRGVEKDEAQAAYWYGKAATQGHAWAQTNLGYMYERGLGVAKDAKLAELWYRKAAEQGHEVAQERLEKL